MDGQTSRLQRAWVDVGENKKKRVETPPTPVTSKHMSKRSVMFSMGMEPDTKTVLTSGQVIVSEKKYGSTDPETLKLFLKYFEETGHIAISAARVNLASVTIRAVRKRDPAFEQEYQEARERFIERNIDDPIRRLGFEGVKEPIFNLRTGELLGHKTRIEPTLTLAYARKFDTAYRDKQDVTMNHTGGVMVVGAPAADVDAWAKQIGTTVIGISGQQSSPMLALPDVASTDANQATPASANSGEPAVDAEYEEVERADDGVDFTPLSLGGDVSVVEEKDKDKG